jgi:hypothetical protein
MMNGIYKINKKEIQGYTQLISLKEKYDNRLSVRREHQHESMIFN